MSRSTIRLRWVCVLAAVLLLAGACSGDDDGADVDASGAGTEQSDDPAADGGDAGSGDGTNSGGDDGDGSPDPDPGGQPGGTPSAGGQDAGAGGGQAAGGASTGGEGGGGPAAPAAGQPTAAGTYHYTVDGTATQGTTTEELPDQTLKVAPPEGARQSQVQTADDGGSRQELLLEFKADGVYLHQLTVSESGLNKKWAFSPPPVAFPASTAPGTKWGWSGTSDDGQTNLEGAFEVTGAERLTIGGQPVDTITIHAVIKTSGDLTSTSDETWWLSPQHRLVVKSAGSSNGAFGPFTFSGQHTTVLDSLQPS